MANSLDGNWIRVHRQSLDSQVFSDPFLWQLFCWCLLKANWKDGYFQGQLIPRGSFATGREAAAESLSISPAKFRRGINRLIEIGCITKKATNRFTLIRVEKYDVFQTMNGKNDQQPANNRPSSEPTTGQPSATIEERKKGRKKELGGKPRFVAPSLEEVSAYVTEYTATMTGKGERWPVRKFDASAFVDYYAANGWKQSKGNPIKDWKAAVRNWGRRDFGDAPKNEKSQYKTLPAPPKGNIL